MDGENQDTERASKEVTVVVNIRIKPGCEKDYDESYIIRFPYMIDDQLLMSD
jgi:hypothetical protein